VEAVAKAYTVIKVHIRKYGWNKYGALKNETTVVVVGESAWGGSKDSF